VLSAEGNTALIGGYTDNGDAGAVWVFTRSGGTWTQQGTKLVGSGASANAKQGASVALSTDGNTSLIGAPKNNTGAGAAFVFTRSGSTWTQQGAKLNGSGAIGSASQGDWVALSGDGNTALSGGTADNSGSGAVWVFTRHRRRCRRERRRSFCCRDCRRRHHRRHHRVGRYRRGVAAARHQPVSNQPGDRPVHVGHRPDRDAVRPGAQPHFRAVQGQWRRGARRDISGGAHAVATPCPGHGAARSNLGQQGTKLAGSGGDNTNQGYSVGSWTT
jgi:hypothetical protein